MRDQQGFTLIEMSIVVVIIGALISGIMIGRSLIESAENRSIQNEYSSFASSFSEFSDRYLALPGDMVNAETQWGSDSNCPNTTTNTTRKVATCNGGGNGIIGDWTNGSSATAGSEYEWFRAWQHLANAGFVAGSFTGVSGSTSTEATPGLNVPRARSDNGGWMLLYMISDGTTDSAFFTSRTASHALIYGAAVSGGMSDGPLLKPSQAKEIDTKMDDGMPFTGQVRVKKSSASSCTASALSTADYLLSSEAKTCTLIFLMGV